MLFRSPVHPDRDAEYVAVRRVDLSAMEPLVALPDSVLNNSRPVGEVAGTPVHQAFIGSCANGTLDDLALAARVLKGRKVSPETRLIVTPASQHVYRQALRAGVIEVLAEAGGLGGRPAEEMAVPQSTRHHRDHQHGDEPLQALEDFAFGDLACEIGRAHV